MKLVYLASFHRDVKKLKDRQLKKRLKQMLLELENVSLIEEIAQLKKLRGHPFAYRIRIGDYRLALYCEEEVLELVRFFS
jgi:mRNA interferase RelE/StbE